MAHHQFISFESVTAR
jgi:hypothetical protein